MSEDSLTGFQNLKGEVLASLREVAELAEDLGAESMSGRLSEERIPRLEQERFHLVVLGEFNHGKTTFVNALIGEGLLPAGVTPTTAVIHHVTYGSEPKAVAIAEEGESTALPLDRVGDYVVGGQAVADSVQYLEVQCPAEILKDGVVLVDTPGVNDLNLSRAEVTYSYLPKADAILFLLDAGQILKESERSFIANKLLKQSRDKVIFIINKVDLLDAQEREEALAYAQTHLARLVEKPRIYAVSSEQALQGERQDSGFDAMIDGLQSFLSKERGRVILDNALDEGLRATQTLRRSLDVQRRALVMDQSDLERRLAALEGDLEQTAGRAEEREAKIRESLAAVKALVSRDTKAFAERFSKALPIEIESSKGEDLKRYLPGFMEERFRNFAESQGEMLTAELEKVAEEAIAFIGEDAKALNERLKATLGENAPDVNLEVNTLAYDVSVIALGAFGIGMMALSNVFVGGAMTLAAPVLAYFLRGRAETELRKRAMEEAPKAVATASEKLVEAFEYQIDEFGAKLVAFVNNANEEMTRSVAEVVRAARSARQAGEDEIRDLEERTGAVSGRLKAVENRMNGLRTSLWMESGSTQLH